MTKKAFITGVTGQDGSYLAEFLLTQGYEVYGMVRRTSTVRYDRIKHIQDDITLVPGDIADQMSMTRALQEIMPDEVYNLAAQSFVPTSWSQPVFTGDITGLGTTRILEAIRTVNPEIRFYQASSSEMFGKVQEVPQKETTPFYPRSPYGVAKVYGHWITVNYRESYNMHASSGILFNHECVTNDTTVFIRKQGLIDLLPIEDVVPHRTDASKGNKYTTEPNEEIFVWDANGWSRVTCMTATWNNQKRRPNKTVHRVAARGAVYHATSDHVVFTCKDNRPTETPAGQVQKGDQLALIALPEPTNIIILSEDEAWLLGILAAEGYVDKNSFSVRVTNQDQDLLDEVAACWRRVTGGNSHRRDYTSGFENGNDVTQMDLTDVNGSYRQYLREQLYTQRSGYKRIPQRILNASYEARMAFLRGFNAGDGLKSPITLCKYEFQGFKTASPVLAAGLYWLAVTTLKQHAIICLNKQNDRIYYQINLNSPDVPGQKGQHLHKPLEEVVKAEPIVYEDWLFDLATESGTFHAGIGQGWIHNSPRRGLEFVTRKISYNVAKIKLGQADELRMGNYDAQRDWGFAGDYVQAMWLMLQQDTPDDYVVATGQTHSVQRLLEVAFSTVDLDWQNYTVQDERFMRPAEVDLLVGDPTKAHAKLGWEPAVSFEELIQMMVEADLHLLKKGDKV